MAPPGGAANVYGILYQLLGTLHRAVILAIRPGDLWDPVSPPLVIIEPAGGGGDLREVHGDGLRRAIQFKTRSDGRTWSLNQIIDEVLPDLYKAVDVNRLAEGDRYQFSTEGHIGAWTEAKAFFEQLAAGPPPADPLAELSDQEFVKVAVGRPLSHRALFERIVAALRAHGARRGIERRPGLAQEQEPVELTRRKAWHLLRGLEFVTSSRDELTTGIDARLSLLAPAGEAAADMRARLVMSLLELAGTGDVRIEPATLLARARVTLAPLKAFADVRERLRQRLADRFVDFRYRADADVRATPVRGQQQIQLFAGDSGDGKTWQLCSVALRSLDSGFAIVRAASGRGEETWARALETAWGEVGSSRTASFGALLERLRAEDTGVRPEHIDVFVDNVQLAEEAFALIERVRDEPPDVRLVLTVPLELGRSLQAAYPEIVALTEVPRFDDQEFEQFFDMRGLDWRRIPPSVQPTLRQPLLAEMYAQSADDGRIQPEFEYEVFEAYWRRLYKLPAQIEHRGDASLLADLAAAAIEDGRGARAWGQAELRARGADVAWQNRVERTGWLQRVNEDVGIWHDRLFGWAAAKGIVERRRNGTLSSEALAQRVEAWGARTGDGSGVGALTLDVIWLAIDPVNRLTGEVGGLLDAFERGVATELLHDTLLPRLGLGIVAPLLDRLRRRNGNLRENRAAARHVAATLIALAKHHPREISAAAGRLIHDASEIPREAGLLVLHKVPAPAELDQLWDLHRASARAMERRDENRHRSYLLTFDALRTSVDGAPEWLANRIRSANPEIEPMQELAYLLAGLRSGDPAQLWSEFKPLLLATVPEYQERALVACIRRFRDVEEIDRLRGWLTKTEVPLLGTYAFAAIAVIAPAVALEVLETLPVDVLGFARSLAMPALLHLVPVEVQHGLRRRLSESPKEFWKLASMYHDLENQLDSETVAAMIDRLEIELDAGSEGQQISRDLHWALEVLSRIWRSDLLDLFEARRGTRLERQLTDLAMSRVESAGVGGNGDLEDARLVLLKINGEGFAALAEAEVCSSVPVLQRIGMRWAIVRPTPAGRARMRRLASEPNPGDDSEILGSGWAAVEALAVLGDNEGIVHAIVHGHRSVVTNELVALRETGEPFEHAQLEQLLPLLRATEPSARRVALIVGISRRPELAPRLVELLLEAPTDSDFAFGALMAICCLGTAPAAAIPALARHLATDRKEWAVKALLKIATPAALTAIREASAAALETDVDFCVTCAIDLAMGSSGDDEVRDLLWRAIQRLSPHHLPPTDALHLLAAGRRDGVERYLREIAFGPDQHQFEGQPDFRAEVIRALARLSRRSALSALEWALTEPLLGREHLPRVLFDVDARVGLETIVRLAPSFEPELRWAASRALRSHLRPDVCDEVTEAIARLLDSTDPVEREAGVDLARFLEPARFQDRLERLLVDDNDPRVQHAVAGALRVHQAERVSSTLLDRLARADDHGWPALFGIAALADPDRLGAGDASLIPLSTQRALTPAMRHALRRCTKERREQRESAERTEAVQREGNRRSAYPAKR